MFTTGQLVFGIFFTVLFAVIMIYTYRKDLKLHRKYYKGSIWVLIAFIAFILMLTAAKFILS